MEPVAIVTAFVGALYVVGRGPLVVAPDATVAFYRRWILSPPGRLRWVGGLMLVLVAAPLVVTARQARADLGDITILIEGFGWLAAAVALWVLAAPRPWHRVMMSFWDAASDPGLRRVIGAINVAFGLFLAWVAFFRL